MVRKRLCHKRNVQMTLRPDFRNCDACGENFRLCATHTGDARGWRTCLVKYLTEQVQTRWLGTPWH